MTPTFGLLHNSGSLSMIDHIDHSELNGWLVNVGDDAATQAGTYEIAAESTVRGPNAVVGLASWGLLPYKTAEAKFPY